MGLLGQAVEEGVHVGAVGLPRAAHRGAALDVSAGPGDHLALRLQLAAGLAGLAGGLAVRPAQTVDQHGRRDRGGAQRERQAEPVAKAVAHGVQLPGPQLAYSGSSRRRITCG